MSYIDDFIRDYAPTLGREEASLRLRYAGYDEREIRDAWRRAKGTVPSPPSAGANRPAVTRSDEGPRSEGAAPAVSVDPPRDLAEGERFLRENFGRLADPVLDWMLRDDGYRDEEIDAIRQAVARD